MSLIILKTLLQWICRDFVEVGRGRNYLARKRMSLRPSIEVCNFHGKTRQLQKFLES